MVKIYLIILVCVIVCGAFFYGKNCFTAQDVNFIICKDEAVTEFVTDPFSYVLFVIFTAAVALVSKKDEVYCQ